MLKVIGSWQICGVVSLVWYIFIDLVHTIIANQILAEPHLLNPIEPIYLVKKNCLCLSWRGYSALVYSKEGSSLEEVNSLSWNYFKRSLSLRSSQTCILTYTHTSPCSYEGTSVNDLSKKIPLQNKHSRSKCSQRIFQKLLNHASCEDTWWPARSPDLSIPDCFPAWGDNNHTSFVLSQFTNKPPSALFITCP